MFHCFTLFYVLHKYNIIQYFLRLEICVYVGMYSIVSKERKKAKRKGENQLHGSYPMTCAH